MSYQILNTKHLEIQNTPSAFPKNICNMDYFIALDVKIITPI